MARFIRVPKNGTVLIVNVEHVHAVIYTPTHDNKPQVVKLMGQISLSEDQEGMQVYAHSVLETADFEDQKLAEKWIDQNFILFNT